MTKNERALWALDVMSGIDAALIDEAEAGPRRTGRRIVSIAAAAALLTLLAVSGVMMHRRDHPPQPSETSEAPTTTAHVHAESSGAMALQIAHIRWQGVAYELTHDNADIVPGAQLGTIDFCNYISCMGVIPDDDPRRHDMTLTASNIIPVGAAVYACEGYPTAWRICAYNERGELCVFSRSWITSAGESLAGRRVGELFPALETIDHIAMYDTFGIQLYESDASAEITALLTPLVEKGIFIDRDTAGQITTDQAYTARMLTLTFADGSTSTIRAQHPTLGFWLEHILLPDGFYQALDALPLYPNSTYGDRSFDYGNTSASNIGLMDEYADDYENFTVWLEGSRLYLGSFHGSDRRVLLTDDAAGDIRIEGLDVFYRTTTGAIACITYACPGIGSFYSLYNKGIDMTDFITAQTIVDPGPHVRFQLRLGVRWTLDAKGQLSRNGKIVAEGVRDFNLDAAGVVYAAAEGAYRRAEDGTVVQLTNVPVTAIATSGLYVYYATEAGELHRVRCDGARDMLLGHIDAVKLVYSRCNGSSADCLAILTADGRACFLMEGILYTIADNVTDIDAFDGIYLRLTLADGTAVSGQLDYFSQPDPDYRTPAGLQFEGIPITAFIQFR